MEGYRRQFVSMHTVSHKGPLVLVDGEVSDDDLTLAARVAARFGQGRSAETVTVAISRPDGTTFERKVAPLPPSEMHEEWYV